MKVTANGTEYVLREGALLPELLDACGMAANTSAVWINDVQPLFAQYETTELHDGDEVRIYFMCIGG